MKIYEFVQGNACVVLHHDGTIELTMNGNTLPPLTVSPEDVEDLSTMLATAAARSERMHHDIGSFPTRCPFRKGDGLAFGARCVREVHADGSHTF